MCKTVTKTHGSGQPKATKNFGSHHIPTADKCGSQVYAPMCTQVEEPCLFEIRGQLGISAFKNISSCGPHEMRMKRGVKQLEENRGCAPVNIP